MIKKVIIRRGESVLGYEFVEIHEDGNENIIPLDRKTSDECLYLPENSMGRKYISISKLEKNGGYLELFSKVGLEEYLDDDDRKLYLSLIEKAQNEKKRREEEAKNLSPEEKAKREVMKQIKKCLELGIDIESLGIKI